MSRYRMHAIEYNTFMTLLKLLSDRMPPILKEYNMSDDIHIQPAYPRDITSMHKPSIIVRRVDAEQYKIGMGNVLGQLFDEGIYKDVSGIKHAIMMQFDIVANSNTQNLLLQDIMMEDIFDDIIINESGTIQLLDFTKSEKNPTNMGVITIYDTPRVISFQYDDLARPTLNNDYKSMMRLMFIIVQEILPKQRYVDLSKWIRIKQTIKVKGGNEDG